MARSMPKRRTLKLDDIRLDGDCQPRVELDPEVVVDYADAYKAGGTLPPLTVIHDGADYWLTDGFHRRFAAAEAGLKKLPCNVIDGTLEDARWMSYAANQKHGLRRSNADKAKAVTAALKHPKADGMSDRMIADHVGVSNVMVSKHRQLLTVNTCDDGDVVEPPKKRVGKDGKKYPAKQDKPTSQLRSCKECSAQTPNASGYCDTCIAAQESERQRGIDGLPVEPQAESQTADEAAPETQLRIPEVAPSEVPQEVEVLPTDDEPPKAWRVARSWSRARSRGNRSLGFNSTKGPVKDTWFRGRVGLDQPKPQRTANSQAGVCSIRKARAKEQTCVPQAAASGRGDSLEETQGGRTEGHQD